MSNSQKICYKCKQLLLSHEPVCAGLHQHCYCSWFQIDIPEDFQDIVARSSESTANEWDRITSSFFHGKFRKYSGRLGSTSYLLKVQQQEVPELPAMEYLCNQIARSCGLQVPDHFFIRFQNALDAFVCKNFMQEHPGSNLIHIYRFLDSPHQFSCEGLLNVLEKNVKRHDDINRFVQLCLFDSLIGNHDRHGRNLGLIESANELRLAPFYDNPSYLAIEDSLLLGAFHEPRGAIVTQESTEPTMRDYVKEWSRLGYNDSILEFKNQVHFNQLENLIRESFISSKRQQSFLKLITRRYGELEDAVQKL